MRRLSDLLVLLVSLLVVFAFLEGGLRLFWDDYYMRAPRGNVEFHPTRGWANKPGARVQYGKPEYSVIVSHNSRGFRGPEIAERKSADRLRVLTLGDSMAYGFGVEDDETFSAVLDRLDPRLEVINGGVAGYSAAEELLLLREEGPALSPDLVLVAFLWNDLEGAYRDTYGRFTVEDGGVRFEVPPEGSPDHPALKKKRVRHPWLSRSYLYRFVSDRLKILRYTIKSAAGVSPEVLGLPPAQIEPAWALTFALLGEIASTAATQGAETLLVILPDQIQVEPDAPPIAIDPNLYAVQDRLAEFGRQSGIAVLDLTPRLREAWERGQRPLYFRFDRHFTPLGHRVAAETILEWLEEHDSFRRPR
jgi:lysophospholipase L1-like esterase